MATSPATAPTAAQEWRANWTLALAAMMGLSFGSVPSATLGLFMEPLEAEFGWSRAMISAGMMVFAAITLPLTPFAGALVDKWGARRCGIPGLVFSGIFFAAFSQMTGASWMWWAIWVLYSLASLFIRSVVWNQAASSTFSASLGLATAIVLSGLALTQVIAPPLVHFLISDLGWRWTYAAMGLGWAGVALVLVFLFFRVPQQARQSSADSTGTTQQVAAPGGLTLGEALRAVVIYRIGFSMLVTFTISSAIGIHIVPMLEWAGTSRIEAASLASVLGIGSIVGKLLTGWLADRIESGFLPFLVVSIPALGYFLVWQGGASFIVLGLSVFLMGYGSGGALQMGIYLTTRYGGIRNFGKIYGLISSLIGLSGGLGPVLAGRLYDVTGSYETVLLIAMPAIILAGLAVFGLGPYPQFKPQVTGSAET